jgi:hypothetical protein
MMLLLQILEGGPQFDLGSYPSRPLLVSQLLEPVELSSVPAPRESKGR